MGQSLHRQFSRRRRSTPESGSVSSRKRDAPERSSLCTRERRRRLKVVDRLTAARRSENMRKIRSRNTSPELTVRRFLHRSGFRYRLHSKSLPGKPDVVLPALRACVLIHGCFWHGCTKCVDGTRRVKSHSEYWTAKIRGNQDRDVKHADALRSLGWKVYVLWECRLRRPSVLRTLARSLQKRRERLKGMAGVGDAPRALAM